MKDILKYLSGMTTALATMFKRDPKLTEQRAKKLAIKNEVRAKKAEAKVLRLERKVRRLENRLKKKEGN